MKPQVQFFSFVEYHKVFLKLSLALQHVLQFLERAHVDKRLRDINLTCYVNKDFIVQVLVCTSSEISLKHGPSSGQSFSVKNPYFLSK